jgi:hypothetical protein
MGKNMMIKNIYGLITFCDACLFYGLLFLLISLDYRSSLIRYFTLIVAAIVHHVAEKVPASCA